ncbi:MarR family protein [Candidatus Desulfosporosinus infrequens]|uniref:MarR family protein n=1 Tax=Candidatus Desulfosporosinus infrequens TaxID=2043169 RepID=A0A2U3KIR6_9FIRM|nr:MarR family protein [Candidatus Desulfosporosinus infrequens]
MNHLLVSYPKLTSPCHCLNIRRASRAVTQFYETVLEPSDLKVTQYSLLRNLELVEPVTISELAKTMRIDRTTLNRNMKPLIDVGLIAVNSGDDPRSKHVVLTEAGRISLLKAGTLWCVAQASLKEYMGEAELATLEVLLSKLEALIP